MHNKALETPAGADVDQTFGVLAVDGVLRRACCGNFAPAALEKPNPLTANLRTETFTVGRGLNLDPWVVG